MTIEQLKEYAPDTPIGAIRASFGYTSSIEDVMRLLGLVYEFTGASTRLCLRP